MQSTPTKRSAGFTLVEVMVVAPLIILFIGSFVGLIVALTGNSLQIRESNAAAYNTQDAIDDMQITASGAISFLTTTGTLQSPQGKNDSTTAFTNTESGKPDTLIIQSPATTKNPVDPTAEAIYTGTGACNNKNPVYTYTTIYMVSGNSLYKRTVIPQIAACKPAWQKGSCSQSYVGNVNLPMCVVADEKLLDNVSGIDIQYYQNPYATSPINDSLAESAVSISIRITLSKSVAGEPLTYTGSARISSLSSSLRLSQTTPVTNPKISATENSTDPYSTDFTWDAVGNASSYSIRSRPDGNSQWSTTNVTVTNPSQQQYSHTVASYARRETAEIEVTVNTSSGNYLYGNASRTMPDWLNCPYVAANNWTDYATSWPGARYTRTSSGTVMLDGLVKGGTTGSSNVICTLPNGFRPDANLIFQVMSSGATGSRLDILPNGEVRYVTGSNAWFNLGGVSYIASGLASSTVNLTGANSWIYYGSPYSNVKIMLDGVGRGHIQGLAKGGSTTAGATAFTGFTSTYSFASGANIYAGMHHGNTPKSIQLNGTLASIRYGMAGNSFLSFQAMFYPSSSTTWTNVTLGSSWANYGGGYASAGYVKKSDGIVSLQGLIRNGTATSGTVLFTLPAGFRPSIQTMCNAVAYPDVPARVDISPTGFLPGQVVVREGVVTTWLSLAGCDFIADQ